MELTVYAQLFNALFGHAGDGGTQVRDRTNCSCWVQRKLRAPSACGLWGLFCSLAELWAH